LPPLTHNGEQIEIDGTGYVVTSLVLKYKVCCRAWCNELSIQLLHAGRWGCMRCRR
jgi:hypothetical protein